MKRIDDPTGYKIIDYENEPFEAYQVGYLLSKLEHEIYTHNIELANYKPYIKVLAGYKVANHMMIDQGVIALNGHLYWVEFNQEVEERSIFIVTMSIHGMSNFIPDRTGYTTPRLAGKIINIGEIS